MNATNKALFQSMLDVVKRDPTLCRSFKTDLTTHDRAMLERPISPDFFLWLPYDSGTHVVHLPGSGNGRNSAVSITRQILADFHGVRCFVADRGKLREVTSDSAVSIARDSSLSIAA